MILFKFFLHCFVIVWAFVRPGVTKKKKKIVLLQIVHLDMTSKPGFHILTLEDVFSGIFISHIARWH